MRAWEAILETFETLKAALREIFDEAPYERFLARHQLEAGTASYADFCREHQQGKARRPRCC